VRDDIIFDIEMATIIAEDLEEADIGVNLVPSRMIVFHCYGLPNRGSRVMGTSWATLLYAGQTFQFL